MRTTVLATTMLAGAAAYSPAAPVAAPQFLDFSLFNFNFNLLSVNLAGISSELGDLNDLLHTELPKLESGIQAIAGGLKDLAIAIAAKDAIMLAEIMALKEMLNKILNEIKLEEVWTFVHDCLTTIDYRQTRWLDQLLNNPGNPLVDNITRREWADEILNGGGSGRSSDYCSYVLHCAWIGDACGALLPGIDPDGILGIYRKSGYHLAHLGKVYAYFFGLQQQAYAHTYWALMNKHLLDSTQHTPELTSHFLLTFNTSNTTQATSFSKQWTEHASNLLWPCSFDMNASTVRCTEVLPCDAAQLNRSAWGAEPPPCSAVLVGSELNATTVHVRGDVLWQKAISIYQSSPAVADGVVYVGSEDQNVYALDAKTGDVVWKKATGDEVQSSPAVADGVVYVRSDNMYAFDAKTGDMVWQKATEGGGSPAVADGLVYLASDDNVYALDAKTGDVVWKKPTEGGGNSSPAVADGLVYVASDDKNVYALDAKTGDVVWQKAIGYYDSRIQDQSPAVADGLVVVGCLVGDENVYALDAKTGDVVWKQPTGDGGYNSPAVADGMVYFGSDDQNVYALDAKTGDVVWKKAIVDYVHSSPAVADGVVLWSDVVYAFDAKTGDVVWKKAIEGGGYSSPAVADGVVYQVSDDNNVYALDAKTFTEPLPPLRSASTNHTLALLRNGSTCTLGVVDCTGTVLKPAIHTGPCDPGAAVRLQPTALVLEPVSGGAQVLVNFSRPAHALAVLDNGTVVVLGPGNDVLATLAPPAPPSAACGSTDFYTIAPARYEGCACTNASMWTPLSAAASTPNMTASYCMARCVQAKFTHASPRADGQCWCSSAPATLDKDEASCCVPCPGMPWDACASGSATAIYGQA